MNGKDRLRIELRRAVQSAAKISCLLPVRRRRILFESYEGTAYACNPKYLSEYLDSHCPGRYELLWSFAHPEDYADLPVAAVKRRSLRWFYEYLTAGVRVTNTATQMSIFPKRRGQLVINTWHAGGAYKRVSISSEHVEKADPVDEWRRRTQGSHFDLYLSSSPRFTQTNIREGNAFAGAVLKSGMPRNDLFFRREAVEAAASKVRERLGIEGPLILYAPTYRGKFAESAAVPPFPADALMRGYLARFGRVPVLLSRAHYTDTKDAVLSGGQEMTVVDVTSYPDMQELLCAADLLVTDYSSSIWDYALLGRPCLLYCPDLEQYETADRGFYTPIGEWPGILCRDGAAMEEALRNLDEAKCARKAAEHLRAFRSYEAGHACAMTERVIRHFVRTGELP